MTGLTFSEFGIRVKETYSDEAIISSMSVLCDSAVLWSWSATLIAKVEYDRLKKVRYLSGGSPW